MWLTGSIKFLDNYIKDPESGGREAAQRLREAASNYLKTEIPDIKHDIKILIRVYTNMTGLSKVYYDANILRENFGKFARSFNMSHPLNDFVDAGNGKECSDDKIRGKYPSETADF